MELRFASVLIDSCKLLLSAENSLRINYHKNIIPSGLRGLSALSNPTLIIQTPCVPGIIQETLVSGYHVIVKVVFLPVSYHLTAPHLLSSSFRWPGSRLSVFPVSIPAFPHQTVGASFSPLQYLTKS